MTSDQWPLIIFVGAIIFTIVLCMWADAVGDPIDWDEVAKKYTKVEVTVTTVPNVDDRWTSTVDVMGTFVDQGPYRVAAYTFGPFKDQAKAQDKAREKIGYLREKIAAAQSRKMRTVTETVPL